MLRTNKEIVIDNWRNHGRLVVPAGLKASTLKSHNGEVITYFLEEFGQLFNENSLEYHDAYFYGIRLDAADVTETCPNCGSTEREIVKPECKNVHDKWHFEHLESGSYYR